MEHMKEKLRYRIAVKYESDQFIEAESPAEAIALWQHDLKLEHVSYKVREKEWIKGGFKLVLELQEHLSQIDRDTLGESISIDNISKLGNQII